MENDNNYAAQLQQAQHRDREQQRGNERQQAMQEASENPDWRPEGGGENQKYKISAVVGFLMMMVVKDIEWNEFTEAFPAFLTILTIPLTYSISKGIGYGFISYVLIKAFSGKFRDVHPLMYFIALFFALDFLFPSLS